MSEFTFRKTGRASDKEPAYRPCARGLFLVMEENPEKQELSDDEYMMINLHAQKELCKVSPEFEKAQKHWSQLPKNPDRQMGGSGVIVPKISEDTCAADWICGYDDYDGLIYVFAVTREIDFRTGETWEPIPVFGFSLSRGIETLDDIGMDHRMRYRMYYAFAEKQE